MCYLDSDIQKRITLLRKAYWDQLSSEEQRLLDDWRKESADNESLYQRIKSGETLREFWEWKRTVELEQVGCAIRQKIARHVKRRWWSWGVRVAAIIVVGLTIGVIWHEGLEKTTSQELAGARILPGTAKAFLTLDDGREIVLDKHPIELQINPEQRLQGDGAVLDYSLQSAKAVSDRFQMMEEPQYNRVTVPVGGEYQLILADGTKVWLNAESSLDFPVEFVGEQRWVVLQGEAYFEVVSDTMRPFVVKTQLGMEIKVLGTHFNVEVYPDREEWKTTLVEGRVEVSAADRQVFLSPYEQFNFNQKTERGVVRKVNVREVIAWKNGWFVFDNTPLEEILETVRRWYNIQVEYQDEEVKQLCFTGDLSKYDSFETMVRMFEDTRKIKLNIDGNKLTVGKR